MSWLQLPESRQFRKAAAQLNCPIHRLRRLASRHEWKSRAAAFDNHRANLTSSALDQLLSDEIADWKKRAERFREQEWALHEEMIQAARAAARELREHPGRIKVSDLTKLFDLASILGRRACGMPLDPADSPPPETPTIEPEWEAALRKIYGKASETRAQQSANQPPPSSQTAGITS